ncbi:MAG TPA: hypothetical protein VES95_10490 [Dermatophilaceae bacterium]|nr:hypothetical protein [Dermatophilaceae bacterium]
MRATTTVDGPDDRSGSTTPGGVRGRRFSAALASCATVLAGLALAAGPATAADDPLPQPVDCPTALPTTDAVDGVTGTGWTVDKGTVPAPFTATVLGRITDGILPGVDMIMAELDSPAVNAAGGVWAGMSGSPVYAPDGRLIGSVSYGLAAASPVAGITPAEGLATLFDDPDDVAARARATVAVPKSAAGRLARTGEVTAAEAEQGFRRLPVPLSVSGVSGPGATKLAQRLADKTGLRVLTSGSASASAAAAPVDQIVGGGNGVAALSYGYVTLSGTGTMTYTCNGRAVLFGHPFMGAGPVRNSLHSATAVYIQRDDVWGPFKVANPGGVAGTIDRDRTLGLRAQLGALPVSTTVTSSVTRAETGVRSGGTTQAVDRLFASDAAAYHALYTVDQAMRSFSAPGSFTGSLAVTGTRAGGAAFSLTLGNAFVASDPRAYPLDYQVADWVYLTVDRLLMQPFEKVNLTGISLTGTAASDSASWRSPTVQVYRGRRWTTPGPTTVVSARVGARLPWRATAALSGDPTVTQVRSTSLVPPAAAADTETSFTVGTGSAYAQAGPEPTSLDALLTQLGTSPRNDELRVELRRLEDDRVLAQGTMRFSRAMQPFAASYQAKVSR